MVPYLYAGTDASIPTHIENILKRNYAELLSGRRIGPSKLGLVLVQGYHQIDSGLVLPKIRSDIEDQCTRVAKGLAHKDDVVRKAVEIFHSKFDYVSVPVFRYQIYQIDRKLFLTPGFYRFGAHLQFVKHITRMDVLFGSSFSKLEDVGKPFTRCGKTK
jgi:DNA topoisomerase-3